MRDVLEGLEGFTPGPWEHEPDTRAGRVWVRRRKCLGMVGHIEPLFRVQATGRRDADYAQREKDARLVARAPDLVGEVIRLRAENVGLREALEEARKALQDLVWWMDEYADPPPRLIKAARAALASKGGAE